MILLPVATALFGRGGGHGPQAAFASAPAGDYAVIVQGDDDVVDIVQAVNAATGEVFELARIPHVPGYTSFAAVSPDGRRLALVAADSGPKASPAAGLLFVDLESGLTTRVVEGIDQLQQPLWAADSRAAIVTQTTPSTSGIATVRFLRAELAQPGLRTIGSVLASGAYPVGFDAEGRLLAIAIDNEGSRLLRDFAPLMTLSPGATRDWKLSPDAKALAYIEVLSDGGVQYVPRIVDLTDGAKGAVSGQTAAQPVQGLGVAWEPATLSPVFGFERGKNPAGVSAQAATSETGFDIPLAFSAGGQWLAVQHWSGSDFALPGEFAIELHSANGTLTLGSASRFYGWARR